jgi:hypothetical protein
MVSDTKTSATRPIHGRASATSAAQSAEPVREAVNAHRRPVEKLDRPIAGSIVMVIPSGILPMPVLICSLRKGFLGL